MKEPTRLLVLLATAGLLAAACGDGDSPADDDAGTDADSDTDTDGDTDTDTDGDTDADTDSDTDTGTESDTYPPEDFVCQAVEPAAASTLADALLSLIGTGFHEGMTVTVTETSTSAVVDLGAATWLDTHGAQVTASTGEVAAGTYQVTLTNPDSETAACPGTVAWLAEPPPTVTAVEPPTAWTGTDTDEVISDKQVFITGTNFEETPAVYWVGVSDSSQRFLASVVLFTDAAHLGAVCPTETESMPAGFYYVEVVNPNGLSGFWMDGEALGQFEVTATAPPAILSVNPFRSPAADDVELTILGSYFQNGAVAAMTLPDQTLVPLTTTFVDGDNLTASLPGNTVAQGGTYPVRVTNPDDQYDVWYSYQATSSSAGHLGEVTPSGQAMVTARWRHGSVAGFDDFEGTYIYSSGGLDGDGTVLGDVEVLPVSVFGVAGSPWVAQQWVDAETPRAPNLLNVPRNGHALVRAGKWLYAVGGTEADTHVATPVADALAVVERARILGLQNRPVISSVEVGTGGTLELGTWFYRVSAVGAWGESLASAVKMVYGASGTVTVTWGAVDGAASYNVYRNREPGGNGGVTRLLAAGVTGTSFADDGAATPAEDAATPLPFGSLGRWEVLEEEMIYPREGLDSVVVTVPSGEEDVDDKTFLYAVGGRPDATGEGYYTSGEKAEVLEDGTLAAFEELTYPLNTARAFYVLLTNQGQKSSGFDPGDDPDIPLTKSVGTGALHLLAIMGDDQHAGTANNGLNTFEVCELLSPDGDNEQWYAQTDSVPGGQRTHGLGAALYFDYMFAFPAVSAETLGSWPGVQNASASRFNYVQDAADGADVLEGYQSPNVSFVTSRAYYELVRVNGALWAIGGADPTGLIGAIDRITQ